LLNVESFPFLFNADVRKQEAKSIALSLLHAEVMLVSHEYIDDLACLITILLVGSHVDIDPMMVQIKTI
jgi:hypothetical protein